MLRISSFCCLLVLVSSRYHHKHDERSLQEFLREATGESFSCDIEKPVGTSAADCVLIQDTVTITDDDFDWTRGSGKTKVGKAFARPGKRKGTNVVFPQTGPERASNGEYYLYAEGRKRKHNEEARLQIKADSLTKAGEKCIRFKFSMNGDKMGELAVISKTGAKTETHWSFSKDMKTPDWFDAAVDIKTKDDTKVYIQTKATRAPNPTSDVAIDDLTATAGRCETARPGKRWSCSMETEEDDAATWCDIQQDKSDDFDWTLYTGSTPSHNTGPMRAQSGSYYLYTEASGRKKRDKARLILPPPPCKPGKKCCLEFYMHTFGHHMGSLMIRTVTRTEGTNSRVADVWSSQLTKEQKYNNNWQGVNVTIQMRYPEELLVLEAERGQHFSSDFGLDTISIKEGMCKKELTK